MQVLFLQALFYQVLSWAFPGLFLIFPGDFSGIFQVMPGFSASHCIFSLLFSSAGMISAVQIHPQLALFLRRDDFGRQVSSPACSFSPQG